jgi:formate-dependent nitrite reductase cytochrome c552 subunit
MTKLWCGEVVSSDFNLTRGHAFAFAWTSTRAQKIFDPTHTNTRTGPFACVLLKNTANRGVDNLHGHNPGR